MPEDVSDRPDLQIACTCIINRIILEGGRRKLGRSQRNFDHYSLKKRLTEENAVRHHINSSRLEDIYLMKKKQQQNYNDNIVEKELSELKEAMKITDDRIQCLLCYKWFKELTYSHLQYVHNGITFDEYKNKFGLFYVTSPLGRRFRGLLAKGKRNYWYGSKRIGSLNPMFGKNHSEKTKSKISRIQMGGHRHEKWTREKVIKTLKELFEQGEIFTSSIIQKKYHGLYNSAIRHFDSLANACRIAGIPVPKKNTRSIRHKWTKKKILKNIIKIHKSGDHLNPKNMITKYSKLYDASYKMFGSWKKARTEALKTIIKTDFSVIEKIV